MPHDPHNPASCAQIGRECGDLQTALAQIRQLERDKEILNERIREVEVKWQRTDDALVRYGVALARIVERHAEGTLFPQTAANIAAEALK